MPDEPGGAAAPPHENHLTIEQLSAETGLSVRNLRSHRTGGLLPPPEVRDSVGYYGAEHVARLQLIRELQAEGFNLKGVKRLIDETHSSGSHLLGLKRALGTPFEQEESRIVTAAELARRFGEHAAPDALQTAIDLGALIPVDDARYEMPSPAMLDMAERLAERGIALQTAMGLLAGLQERCRGISDDFVAAFVAEVWKPFQRAGYPQERWDEVTSTIEDLRPLASQGLLVVFQQMMSQAVADAFDAEIAAGARRGG